MYDNLAIYYAILDTYPTVLGPNKGHEFEIYRPYIHIHSFNNFFWNIDNNVTDIYVHKRTIFTGWVWIDAAKITTYMNKKHQQHIVTHILNELKSKLKY